ncbi:hypothetical protein J3E64_000689 [Sphingobium sp. OAS761]|uniref:hypothetical protein n=1 Tax=Sphingobium sp. OAS761 TaxID=2817901 RepID=UPI00209C936E|nr:hypothetical protein [Sphingobium sp. OAS761]MCP1469018.1 hypothetical protein [Sphingobium sp. OAS761]
MDRDDQAEEAGWWSRLTRALFREPAIVLMEEEGEHPHRPRETPLFSMDTISR